MPHTPRCPSERDSGEGPRPTGAGNGSAPAMLRSVFLSRRALTSTPTLPPPLDRDPLAVLAVSTAPIVLAGRYRLLVGALVRLRLSRRGRWPVAVGYRTLAIGLALLATRYLSS